jgi:hypothetical protein
MQSGRKGGDIILVECIHDLWHAWERGEKCRGFWWESPKKKDHLKDQGVDGRMG